MNLLDILLIVIFSVSILAILIATIWFITVKNKNDREFYDELIKLLRGDNED